MNKAKIEFDNEEAFEMTENGYCEACKGSFYFSDSGCYEDCEGFIKEYQDIIKQLEDEEDG